jgi:hypothetical protein
MPEQETIRRAERDKQESKPPSTQAGEFVREEMEHVRQESMAPDLQSKPLPSACPRLAVLASNFLLPARKHHPLARRKEHPRPSLPANAPNPRSAHCVARVLFLPLPPRFPVSHKPTPASAVPQAVIVPLAKAAQTRSHNRQKRRR